MSVRRNLSYNIINNIATVIFPVITIPYVSRILGVENIGIIGFASSYAGYFGIFAGLGISIYGTREIAKIKDEKENRDKLFSELFLLMLISSVICSIIYLITVFVLPALKEQKAFLLLSGSALYLNSFSLDWFFMGRENFKMITIRSVVVKLISLFLMFVLVRDRNDALIYCGISALSSMANNLWNFQYLIRKEVIISFKNLSIRMHIKPLFILLSTSLAISVYTILDTLMLGFMTNYTEVGYYNSATKITKILLPFAVATTSVMIPKISYAFFLPDKKEYKHYLQQSFSVMSFFSAPMALGLFIITPSLVPLFFGNEFLPVIPVLQILSCILLFIGLNNYFGIQVLASSGYESKLFFSILLGAIVNFSLNLVFIPRFGSVGAASTSAFAELIVFFATFFMALKYAKIEVKWIPVYQAVLSSLPMIFLYLFLPEKFGIYNLIILVPFGILSYFFCQSLIFKNKIAFELLNKFFHILKIIFKWI